MFEEIMLEKVWKAAERFIQPRQVYGNTLIKFKTYTRDICNKDNNSKKINKCLLKFIVFFLCLSTTTVAVAETGSFTVHFTGCTEFAGWGPVALAEAQLLVPAGYMIAGATMGQAAIVVRATSCQDVAIGQSAAQPTELSQIGINLVAPDGTGDINNYTVIYVTNSRALAEYFQTAGLPAVLDPQLTYEFTPDSSGTSGQLYVTAAGEEVPAYFLFGTETDPPPNSQQSFLANWWFSGYGGKMKQSTSFSVLSFAVAG